MSLDELRALPCTHCGHRHDLFVLLDRAGAATPGQRWVGVECPDCGGESHLELGDESVAIGSLSPSRPPLFRPEVRLTQPGLRVEAGPEGLVVHLLHRRWFVGRRR